MPLLVKTTFASTEFVKKDRKASSLDIQVLQFNVFDRIGHLNINSVKITGVYKLHSHFSWPSLGECEGDFVFSQCHSVCPDVCGKPSGGCVEPCLTGCDCPNGLYRLNEKSNTCVKKENCPNTGHFVYCE